MTEYTAKKVIFKNRDGEYLLPYIEDENYKLPIASADTLGGIKVDNDTFSVDENGIIKLNNMSAVSVCIEEYINGDSGYRIYSDIGNGKYCEQWGKATGYNSRVTLLKNYRDIDYNIVTNPVGNVASDYVALGLSDISITGFTPCWDGETSDATAVYWTTKGYIA